MFGKLLKHEFKATSRFIWVIYAAILALSVAARFSLKGLEKDLSAPMETILIFLMVAWVLSLVIGFVMTIVLLVRRFQQNLLTDEGYLMFTLPVSVHSLVLAKLIAAAVWVIATGLAIAVSVCIAVMDNSAIEEILAFIRELVEMATVKTTLNVTAIAVELVILLFLGCAVSCLQFYSAMSIGHGFVSHKVLWSVLWYFVMAFALQMLSSVLMSVVDSGTLSGSLEGLTDMQTWHLCALGAAVLEVIVGGVFYVITVLNLQKRLNLA